LRLQLAATAQGDERSFGKVISAMKSIPNIDRLSAREENALRRVENRRSMSKISSPGPAVEAREKSPSVLSGTVEEKRVT
jgi:hypothetical protein